MVIARFNRAHRARIFDVSPAKILAQRMCGHLNPAKGCFRLASYPGENLRSPANGLTGHPQFSCYRSKFHFKKSLKLQVGNWTDVEYLAN